MARTGISEARRALAFQSWCEVQTVNYVRAKTGINRPSLLRIRVEDRWDERLIEVRTDAATIADARSAKRLARNLTIVRFCKEKIVQQVQLGKTKGYISDIPALIKTEELLVGNPDSRPDLPPANVDVKILVADVSRLAQALGVQNGTGKTPAGEVLPALLGLDVPPEHERPPS